MTKFGFLIFVSVFIVSCGKDKGSTSTPLTDAQKTQLKEVIASSARGPMAGGAAVSPGRMITVLRQATKQSDQTTVQMAQKLKTSVTGGQCNQKWNKQGELSGSFEKGQESLLEYAVNGNSCPVNLSVYQRFYFDPTGQKMELKMDVDYEAKDVEFAKLNDVTAMKLNGLFSVNYSSTSVKGDGSFKGNIKSKQYGDVGLDFSMNVDGSNEELKSSYVGLYRFNTFTAELKVEEISKRGSVKIVSYSVNGQAVTRTEFYSFVESNPFMTPTISGQSSSN